MKKIRSLLLTFTLTALISCGDAGFGFDVAAEVPVDPGEIVIPVPALGIPNLNPSVKNFDYDLNNVDGFNDAVNELNKAGAQVYLLGIAYEIIGINDGTDSYDEEVPVESVELRFNDAGGSGVFQLPFSGGVLQNVSKTDLDISALKDIIENRLLSSQSTSLTFSLDVGDVTLTGQPEEIDFEVLVYFDVALRVRNINN